jgi:hypothetical protein
LLAYLIHKSIFLFSNEKTLNRTLTYKNKHKSSTPSVFFSKTIIYEQTGTWMMTKIEEIPYSFELVKAVVQDSKVNFMVNDKSVVHIP